MEETPFSIACSIMATRWDELYLTARATASYRVTGLVISSCPRNSSARSTPARAERCAKVVGSVCTAQDAVIETNKTVDKNVFLKRIRKSPK